MPRRSTWTPPEGGLYRYRKDPAMSEEDDGLLSLPSPTTLEDALALIERLKAGAIRMADKAAAVLANEREEAKNTARHLDAALFGAEFKLEIALALMSQEQRDLYNGEIAQMHLSIEADIDVGGAQGRRIAGPRVKHMQIMEARVRALRDKRRRY